MYCCRQSDCSRTATATTRPSLVPRTARHVDVDAYSTTLSMPEPPSTALAYSLYHLISQYRTHRYNNEPSNKNCDSIPLVGVYDALSAKIFAQNGAPALFLSGFGVSASLLGAPDAGMLNLVEMEMMARNVCSLLRSHECRILLVQGELHPPPLIVDGDTGYGGASNMLRTISALASAGAAAITIEDQRFPKKCTIAAGSRVQVVDRDEAVQRVRCALGARNLYNTNSPNSKNLGAGPWIVARTDCRMALGFREVVERCLRFEELGAEIVYAENLQSREEYEMLRNRLDSRTVTMIAQVQKSFNDTTLLTVQDIGDMGFDFALFGVTPLQCVVSALESTARDFLRTKEFDCDDTSISVFSQTAMADFANVKQVVGFGVLEDFEKKFPCS